MRNRLLLILLTVLVSQGIHGQFWKDSTLSAQAIKEDLMTLKSTIYSTHQSPFFYSDSLEFEKTFLQLENNLSGGTSKQNFLFEIGNLLQFLRDSHTYVNYQDLIANLKRADGLVLPFKIRLLGDAVYISQDQEDLMPPGAKLISINGQRVNGLVAQMHKLSILEGNSTGGRIRISESIFPTLANYVTDLKPVNRIEYQADAKSEILTIDYPALSISQMQKASKKSSKSNPIQLEIHEEKIAVLKISSFSKGSDSKYWKSLHKSFKKMNKQGCRRLILDLRGNTGGSSERMEAIFRYLELQPSNVPANIIARQSILAMERNEATFKGFSKWMLTRFFKKNEDVQNYLRMVQMEPGATDTIYYNEEQKPENHRFTGDAFLLMDGLSGSASVNFASKFLEKQIGVIIGEPCLGPKGGTWGNPAAFRLPNSGISVNVSTIRFNTTNDFGRSPEPIQPHQTVQTTVEDLINQNDAALNWIIERAFTDLHNKYFE